MIVVNVRYIPVLTRYCHQCGIVTDFHFMTYEEASKYGLAFHEHVKQQCLLYACTQCNNIESLMKEVLLGKVKFNSYSR